MEASAAAPPYSAGGSEVHPPGAFGDDDSSRHYAVTASQIPIPTSSSIPTTHLPLLPGSLPLASPTDSTMKERDSNKMSGTRFFGDCPETEQLPASKLRSVRTSDAWNKAAEAVSQEQKKPLRLLDLPVDILKDIIKEVTHTNDMTSLALCHSALHRLTIPHTYSRFDIVWPDATTHTDQRSGVDALTYGLGTLAMAEVLFEEEPETGHNRFNGGKKGRAPDWLIQQRQGNHYAEFTRKFSLGNGPADWVQDYLISKEAGYLLGTVVALALPRMKALESFVWDMPTGILRQVWMSLGHLGYRANPRLEKVWVRWHDNSSSDTPSAVPAPPPTYQPQSLHPLSSTSNPGAANSSSQTTIIPPSAMDHVQHPSFSVLPALRSLSVLDIDELAYLDEMAVLIGRSIDKLRELRVGIARHAMAKEFVTCWDGDGLQQVDHVQPTKACLTIGERRLGGVLGVLTGFVSDMRKPKKVLSSRLRRKSKVAANSMRAKSPPAMQPEPSPAAEAETPLPSSSALPSLTTLLDVLPAVTTDNTVEAGPSAPSPSLLRPEAAGSDPLVEMCSHASSPLTRTPSLQPSDETADSNLALPTLPLEDWSGDAAEAPAQVNDAPVKADSRRMALEDEHEYLDHTLRLENLELERVPLSIPVLQRSIEWTHLTSLTLLHCINHEQLWKTLRRTFSPIPKSPIYPLARTPRKSGRSSIAAAGVEMDYRLNLKKIHTNTVSPALIAFLKETLAPNSLETLFLQETRSYNSPVTVDHIYKGPLRRHRASLKRVLIDSSEKGIDGQPAQTSRWRRWMVGREILAFITSGKMPKLRELGVAMDYRDWHTFLQTLPSIPHLRSLSIPFLADHVHGANLDPRELALQIVDVVALRPEVELCYMGIANKCFEILENRKGSSASSSGISGSSGGDGWSSGANAENDAAGDADESDDVDDDVDDEDGDDVDADEDDSGELDPSAEDDAMTESSGGSENDEHDSDSGDDEEEDWSVMGKGKVRLRLREILFYDDKVAVFKARHGRL